MSVLEIAADAYHADHVADQPALTATIANLLLTASPAHARAAHPRLNPHYSRDDDAKFDVGRVAHSMLLEGDDCVYVVHEPDWRKTVAKEARDYARSIGKVPLLAAHYADVLQMVTAVREQTAAHPAAPLTDGKPEQTLVWEEDGITLKARIDWLRDDRSEIWDVKTTGRSANPQAWSKSIWSTGYPVQAAMYRRGVRAVCGVDASWRWLIVENQAPYAISVCTLAADAWAIADHQLDAAVGRWRECLSSGEWPAYRAEVAHLEAPAWLESQWLAYEEVMP